MVEKNRIKIIFSLSVFIGVSTIVASPWWIKTFIETGDPIFPLCFPFFKSSLWSLAQYDRWHNHYQLLSLKNAMNIFYSIAGTIQREKSFWPTAYLALPLVFLCLKDKRIVHLGIFTLAGYILGFYLTVGDPRFLMPIFPCLVMIAAASFVSAKGYPIIKRFAGCVMAILVLWNMGSMVLALEVFKAPKYFWGLVSREEYLRKMLPQYPSIEYLNKNMRMGEKALFVGEARTFYLKKGVIASTAFDKLAAADYFNKTINKNEVLNKFRSERITHILINHYEMTRLDRGVKGWSDGIEWERLRTFLQEETRMVYQDQKAGIRLFKVRENES